jgi:hypothetical protein
MHVIYSLKQFLKFHNHIHNREHFSSIHILLLKTKQMVNRFYRKFIQSDAFYKGIFISAFKRMTLR